MKHIFTTTDTDIEAGYPEYKAIFDNDDFNWPEKARIRFKCIQDSLGIPTYRLSWFTTDDDYEEMELVGSAEDLY